MLLKISIVVIAFIFMEFVAWFTHKYIMHGILWCWHKDHHNPQLRKGFFERNDRFFLIFAIPSFLCYLIGSLAEGYQAVLFIGIGISLYGLAYFLVHDVFIHSRFSRIKRINSRYTDAILRAHGAHHAKQTKEDCESFGMLIVNRKYFNSRRKI
ncbi:MAG: sterol desaturase family protein [Saprospiraceae bacterium]|nr:sterol desaturase family protein [Saprospiraceae bacterium]